MNRIGTAIVLATSLAGLGVRAGDILYYNDFIVGVDRMAEALVGVAGTHTTTTATDLADFTTKIGSGNYDLGILMFQNSSGTEYDSAANALVSFISGGGKGIFADWTQNANYVAPLGVTWLNGQNGTSFNVTDPALAAGLANPVDLSDPGWGVYSMEVDSPDVAATFVASGAGAIAYGTGRSSIVNGFLTDTFADGAEGVQLYQNEIGYLLGGSGGPTIPDAGSSLALLALSGVAVGLARRVLVRG